jgi:hypothetical protein
MECRVTRFGPLFGNQAQVAVGFVQPNSNVMAGLVCTEKLEVRCDATASPVVEIRSQAGLGNRQIRRISPFSHSQAQACRNCSHELSHSVECARVSLRSSGIGAFNGLDIADSDAVTKTHSTSSPTSR